MTNPGIILNETFWISPIRYKVPLTRGFKGPFFGSNKESDKEAEAGIKNDFNKTNELC